MSNPAFRWQQNDLILLLYVQPKSSRDEFVGLHGEAIKLAITAPPVDGKANQHIQKLLAKAFAVSKQQVILQKGQTSRQKQWQICAPTQIPPALVGLGIRLPPPHA